MDSFLLQNKNILCRFQQGTKILYWSKHMETFSHMEKLRFKAIGDFDQQCDPTDLSYQKYVCTRVCSQILKTLSQIERTFEIIRVYQNHNKQSTRNTQKELVRLPAQSQFKLLTCLSFISWARQGVFCFSHNSHTYLTKKIPIQFPHKLKLAKLRLNSVPLIGLTLTVDVPSASQVADHLTLR